MSAHPEPTNSSRWAVEWDLNHLTDEFETYKREVMKMLAAGKESQIGVLEKYFWKNVLSQKITLQRNIDNFNQEMEQQPKPRYNFNQEMEQQPRSRFG
jgi:hypothetical protein